MATQSPVVLSSSSSPSAVSSSSPSADDVVGDALPYLGEASFEVRDAVKATLANAVGIRIATERVPRGSALLPVGEDKLRALKAEYARLPDLVEGLDAFDTRLRLEQARDVAVPVQRVRMAAEGGLYGEGQKAANALGYTKAGFSQIATFVRPASVRNGFAENLLAMPNDLRATWFNQCAERSLRDAGEVTIRTILAPGEDKVRRVIRAVTSDRHSLATGDDRAIVAALRRVGGALRGAKVRITRDGLGDHTWVEVLWPAVNRQIRVGDSLCFGLRFRNSETKGGSLVIEPFLFDAVCYNLTTAYSTLLDEGRWTVRHVGDLSARLPSLIAEAQRVISPFVQMFADAYKVGLPSNLPTRGEVLAAAGKRLELPESTLTLAAQLWDADGSASAGDTLAGFANALTRASQQAPMAIADEIELAAGKVIAEGWAALN